MTTCSLTPFPISTCSEDLVESQELLIQLAVVTGAITLALNIADNESFFTAAQRLVDIHICADKRQVSIDAEEEPLPNELCQLITDAYGSVAPADWSGELVFEVVTEEEERARLH
ncbi:MAG: hypothetical protein U9Q71_04510 [Pseudomonadota bacterium]|nr:hypothetical protein [Pseudomonadota bacterium]